MILLSAGSKSLIGHLGVLFSFPAAWVIALWLFIGVAIIIERIVFLLGASINKNEFLAKMQKCILAGDVGRAVKLCSAADRPMSRIVKAGLIKVNRPDHDVQAAMDETALTELPKVEARTPYLALLANLAMLSGLLGTVIGLIGAFDAVATTKDPGARAIALAHGISEAMYCTAFGLFGALICLIGFAALNGKTQGLLDDINSATVKVMNLVTGNRSKMKNAA